MSTLHWSLDVAASPEEVYAYATDTTAGPEWTIGLLHRELITPGPLRAGSIWRETRRVAGTTQIVDVEVSEHVGPGPDTRPPYRLAGRSSKMGVKASFLVLLSQLPDGGCRVELSGEISATTLLSRPLAARVQRKLEEQADAPLQLLKQAVELRRRLAESGATAR